MLPSTYLIDSNNYRVQISHWSGGPGPVKFTQDQLEFLVVGSMDQLLKNNDAKMQVNKRKVSFSGQSVYVLSL